MTRITKALQFWNKKGVGKSKPYTGKYSFVRLKRHYRSKIQRGQGVDKFSVQIKNRKGQWKTIGEFTSEDAAFKLLCRAANHIDKYRHIVGDFD